MKIKYLILLFLFLIPRMGEAKKQFVSPQSTAQETEVEQMAVREGEKVIDLLTKGENKNTSEISSQSEKTKEGVKKNVEEKLELKDKNNLTEKQNNVPEIKNTITSLDNLEKEAKEDLLGAKKESDPDLLAGLLAEKKQNNILDSKPETASLPWLKFVLSTVFVCCSLVLVMYLFQTKVKKVALGQSKNEQPLKLVQSLSLGLKKDLHLVHLENTRFLFSSNGNDLQLMHSSEIAITPQENTVPSLPFKQTVITNEKNDPFISQQNIKENIADKIRRAVRELKPLQAQNSQTFLNTLNQASNTTQTKTLSAILNAAQVGSQSKNV